MRAHKRAQKKNSAVLVVFETNNVLFMRERVNFASEQVLDGWKTCRERRKRMGKKVVRGEKTDQQTGREERELPQSHGIEAELQKKYRRPGCRLRMTPAAER